MRKVIKLLDFRYSELRELKFFQGKLILVYTECIQSNKNSLVGGSTGQEQALWRKNDDEARSCRPDLPRPA